MNMSLSIFSDLDINFELPHYSMPFDKWKSPCREVY